jgi:hypothetical protein
MKGMALAESNLPISWKELVLLAVWKNVHWMGIALDLVM